MLYDNYNQFLERSRRQNRSSVRTKANKTEDQFHQANIHDCEDMVSYLKKIYYLQVDTEDQNLKKEFSKANLQL